MPKRRKAQISESFLAVIWKRQLVRGEDLMTTAGEKIQVIYPGEENSDSGPDFLDAVITTGHGLLRGDIELHIEPSDWQAHGHHRDPNYNGVILHVVMWDDPSNPDTPLQNGEKAPILPLHRCLAGSIEELHQIVQLPLLPPEPCSRALKCRGLETMGQLLDKVGEERFCSQSEQFKVELETSEAGQAFYEGIMVALGYAKNKKPFLQLARRLPLSTLEELDHPQALQALFFGVAGLLPEQRCKRDKESEGWVRELEYLWHSFSIRETMAAAEWRFFRVRPENFPTRRIAAASYLLTRYRKDGLLNSMLRLVGQAHPQQSYRELEQGLIVKTDGYWATHFDFGVEARPSPTLTGRGRAREIAVNVLLPFSFAWAETTSQTWLKEQSLNIYRNYPPLGRNWITRHMERQIFSEVGHKSAINSARRQQGLIHLYKNFCTERRCDQCPLAE